MLVNVRNITMPARPAVDLSGLVNQAMLDSDVVSDLAFYGAVATEMVEKHIDASLITRRVRMSVARELTPQTLVTGYRGFPYSTSNWMQRQLVIEDFALLRGPVQSVESVSLVGWDGSEQTLTPVTDYHVDLGCTPARLRVKRVVNWRETCRLDVTYMAGFGTNSASVPVDIQMAIRLAVTHFNQHRGDTQDAMPPGYDRLLSAYRTF